MNTKSSLLLAAGLVSTLFTGCVGTGPNTQQGAVGGAAVGALLGAVIGNNSGGHHAGEGALIGAAAGAIAGGTMGNAVDHQNGTLYTSEAQATTNVVYEAPPQAPVVREEVIFARPSREMVWIGGYWVFTGRGGYAWVPGRWVVPPPHCTVFVAPHWQRRHGNSVYVQGYWHN